MIDAAKSRSFPKGLEYGEAIKPALMASLVPLQAPRLLMWQNISRPSTRTIAVVLVGDGDTTVACFTNWGQGMRQ